MTSPAHDATALAAAIVLFPVGANAVTLAVAAVLVGAQGLAHAHATREQERRQARADRETARLRALGLPAKDVEVRWDGPRKEVTRPIRLAAVLLAAMASLPAAVALASARLPDQLEVGPIDHRKLTHYLVTAAAVIYGTWWGVSEVAVRSTAEAVAYGLATGYLMHLLMDGFTRHGVPYFWPLWREPVHLLPEHPPLWLVRRLPGRLALAKVRVKTGGRIDTAVMLGSVGVVVLVATS